MSGIFVVAELTGDIATRIRAIQQRFDPRMAAELPPHVTLIGSSGAGPIAPGTTVAELRDAVAPVAASTAPIPLRFGRPLRFLQREIVVLPLDPHGPLRTLHERLRGCGLSLAPARWPFTPHCTLSFYPTLTPDSLRALLAVREAAEWTLSTLRAYRSRDPQPPEFMVELALGATAAVK